MTRTLSWFQIFASPFSVLLPTERFAWNVAGRYAVAQAEDVHRRLAADFREQAQYLVTLGHRIRYLIKMNAREAMHLIELRSSPQGHPSYRRVAQQMHRLIDQVAGHHLVARAMRFVGSEDVHLPRYAAETARAGAD